MPGAGKGQRGYLMMAALLIASVIALGFFLANTGALQVLSLRRFFSSQSTASKIDEAIVRFAAVNQRLPCPANPALAASNAAAGYADGDVTSSAVVTCSFPAGVVPWRTLGLTPDAATDPWGRMISYRVYDGSVGFTKVAGASAINCDTDNLTTIETPPINGLCASDTNTLRASFTQYSTYPGVTKGLNVTDFGTSVPKVAYALISHGPSGLGGYLSSGARFTLPGVTAADYPNTQAAGTVINAAMSLATVLPGTAGHFDDVVSYRKIDDLLALAKLDARDWPEAYLPNFSAQTTTNMTSASADPANPHFMSTGSTASGTAFTAQQASFGGGPTETVIYGPIATGSFGSCLWWPVKLTLNDGTNARSLTTYMEFAATDNTSDSFPGFTMGFLSGNDAQGAPTNDTCGTTSFSTTASGLNAVLLITVADTTNIVPGLTVTGSGIGTSFSGTLATVSLVVPLIKAVTLSQLNTGIIPAGTVVTFANSRLIRRDLGWAGGTVSAYANRFAAEYDANIDTGSAGPPVIPTANDPSLPHLAVDHAGVVHGTDAESCATQPYGSGCDVPPTTFSSVAVSAGVVSGQSQITVSNVAGIVQGMSVSGSGIGFGATVTDISGNVVFLSASNTANRASTTVTFASLSSSNFMQNGLSVFHSIRSEIQSQACVSKSGTLGVSGANTLTVASTTGIAPGMGVYGKSVARGTTVTAISGNTVTLSSSNTSTVNETIGFALLPSTTKSATGSSGASTIAVSDNRGIGIGMAVSGAGLGSGASVTGVSGTTITLSVANASAISAVLTFTPSGQTKVATGAAGQSQIAVADVNGIAVGMSASGDGIGSGATVTAISGSTITLSAANTAGIAGSVSIRPPQTLFKTWTLSSAGCNADAATCNALKDVSTPFGSDMTTNTMALHSAFCLATPSPSNAFDTLYFGITTSNRGTTLTGAGDNLGLRRLTVDNPVSQ